MNLPPLDKVFFTHYQCANFDSEEHPKFVAVKALFIHFDGKTTCYDLIQDEVASEATSIINFCFRVKELEELGHRAIHWGQTKSSWGLTHLSNRINHLVNTNYKFKYNGVDIDLSNELIKKHGERYVPHPRLDNLAKLNNFNGCAESNPKNILFYGENRTLLIAKIYNCLLNNELIVSENLTKLELKTGELSAFEIALKYWYLVRGRIEPYLKPKEVGQKYGHLRSSDNIEKSYSKIDKGLRRGDKSQLLKLQDLLSEYPAIQKLINSDLDKL